MEANVAPRISRAPLSGLHAGDGRRLLRNLSGGLLVVAVWLSLWAWVAVGVVRPLSTIAPAAPAPAALAGRGP